MKAYLDYNIKILNNSEIPSYPLPDMEDTLLRFLEWVQPLMDDNEYKESENIVASFIKSDDAKKLHEKIYSLSLDKDDSWIFDYWFEYYLKIRGPLVPHTSVPMVYENQFFDDFNILEKAASLIYGVARTYCKFKDEGNGAYYMGKKRYSSDQFHGTLASINHIERDMNSYYINSGFSRNILLLYRNHIYSLEVIGEDYRVHHLSAIYKSIKEIYNGSRLPKTPNINFVTAEPDKDIGGDYLSEILKDPANKSSYQEVKDAIFFLSLDEDEPKTLIDELYCACLDRKNFNRFHGKGLEFAISKNGLMSFIVDHTFSDAGIAIYLTKEMNLFLKNLDFRQTGYKVPYRELEFKIKDNMALKLIKSFEDYKLSMNSFTARYIDLKNLSRSSLREHGVLSGDGFFHIALQAAQEMTYGDIYNTYIAVDMRTFFKGRTEANRPITPQSVSFVKEFLNPSKDILRQKTLLKEALDAHYKRTLLCSSGNGVNRYLFVLEKIYHDFKDELYIKERPPLFDSKAYRIINENKISSSSFSNENLKCSYFPPVSKAGLGIYYSIGDESFAIITAFNDDVDKMDKFNENLKFCVDKMLSLVSTNI